MDDFQSKSGLNSTQKTGFVLLLLFGVLTIGLGFLQMRNNIFNPFATKISQADRDIDSFLDEETRLQMIDTDHDGLNDWEELNFYETSPYLPDTDSDGVDDKREVDLNMNPLCPEGEDCNRFAESLPNAEEQSSVSGLETQDFDIGSLLGSTSSLDMNQSGGQLSVEDVNEMIKDPNFLRQLLLEAGNFSEEDLAKITDEELLNLVSEVDLSTLDAGAMDGTTTSTF